MKEKGNHAFKQKKYEEAENFYSEALQLNPDSRPLWTNRAACRNTMKKHEDALADCLSALSIDPKNTKKGIQTVFHFRSHCLMMNDELWLVQFETQTKTIIQKGNALLGLGQFDAAKECYESLRELGENSAADQNLKKLDDIQEKDIPLIKVHC